MKEFWDARYSAAEFAYGEEPNRFFSETISRMKPGRMLLPAEGEGRNAVQAARLGWSVAAFDFSESARNKALALTRRYQVEIDYQIASYASFNGEPSSFDAVGLIFAHALPLPRETFHRYIETLLKPGGSVILEAFSPDQLNFDSGGPKDESMLYTEEVLRSDFAWLNIETLNREIVVLDEGVFHRGEASVVRMVGTKPNIDE